ncbi:hypothetical protein Q0M94_24915 (plasmid) [Deinococcus radiomollis]|uniref:hypothetical protein n=1 Tax=Deinococcus radiomollis TaxID=468916 RepID=UPI0038917D31
MTGQSTTAYIQTVLLTAPEGGLTPTEIVERAGLPIRAVRPALEELCAAGIIVKRCLYYYAITSREAAFWDYHVRRLVEHIRTAANTATKEVMRALGIHACLLHDLCERGNIEVVNSKRIRILQLRNDVQAAKRPYLNARQCAALTKHVKNEPKMMVCHFVTITGLAADDAKIVLADLEARGIVEAMPLGHTNRYMLAHDKTFKTHPSPAPRAQTATVPRHAKAAPACRNARKPTPTIRPAEQPVTERAMPTPAELPVTTAPAPTMTGAWNRIARATLTLIVGTLGLTEQTTSQGASPSQTVSPRGAPPPTITIPHSIQTGVTGPPLLVMERRAAPDGHLYRVLAAGGRRAPPTGKRSPTTRPPDEPTGRPALQVNRSFCNSSPP